MDVYPQKKLSFIARSLQEVTARAKEFSALAQQRRSVRHFDTRPVPWEAIEAAIEAAGSAPSGANQQPWTFVVISDPETKRRLREAAEAEERESYEHRMSEEWLEALAPLGTDWRKPHLTEAPLIIVVFEQIYGLRPDGSRKKHYYAQESVGIAVGVLLSALHYAGLATLTHTPSPMGFLRELLERPANERAMVVIPVGFPAEGCTVPEITRKALQEILVRC
jgi:iodotyrosine deiodinase